VRVSAGFTGSLESRLAQIELAVAKVFETPAAQ